MILCGERDLHLLLLANSQYELNIGGSGETTWELDLEGLEKSVIKRYVHGNVE